MSHLPIDPDADSNRRAWLPCPNCNHDCPHCQDNHTCQAHWQYLLKNDGNRVCLQCPTCAHTWTADAVADGLGQRHGQQEHKAVVATIPLGGRTGEVATSAGGHVYVMVADSVKVINRLHHIVATYRTGPHPKNIIMSADGTHFYVTGYDGSTSVISVADYTVKTFALQRSTAEAVSPDGKFIYLVHSGIVGDTKDSWISVISADGATVAVAPVDRHATGIGVSPDGTKVYISSRNSSSYLDWRGSISVIDAGTYRVVDKIALELAPDTVMVSRDSARLYATHYHKNSVSIIDLRTRGVARWQFRDAPIDIVVSPDERFAYVTNLQSLTVLDTTTNMLRTSFTGGLPRAVRLSADGKRAYAFDAARRIIRALDTADNSVVGTLDVDGHPEAMALGADGEFLYITDHLDDTVTVIATALVNRKTEER
jgi:YVTN family beta-propeller protein